jgi:hypothetical protein
VTNQEDFDGCYRKCRVEGKHSLEYGRCEYADKPESTVSMSKAFIDTDGHPSIGYDQYTVQQLANELIEPALRKAFQNYALLVRGEAAGLSADEYAAMAREAAYSIVHRNDKGENG